MTVFNHIGHEVRELRLAQGDTQESAALNMDISPSYLRRIEHGTGNPTIKTLWKIACNYKKDLTIMFTPEDDK